MCRKMEPDHTNYCYLKEKEKEYQLKQVFSTSWHGLPSDKYMTAEIFLASYIWDHRINWYSSSLSSNPLMKFNKRHVFCIHVQQWFTAKNIMVESNKRSSLPYFSKTRLLKEETYRAQRMVQTPLSFITI